MSYATVIKAESVGQDIKVEITSNRRGIGRDAGCEFPNADGTNTDATKVEFKDNAAMDFLRKILNEVSYPQASILATVLTYAVVATVVAKYLTVSASGQVRRVGHVAGTEKANKPPWSKALRAE